jgi:hypothetical protein
MTKEEFYNLIQNPDTVSINHIPDLKEMIDSYPYFCIPRLLLSKVYLKENNINYSDIVNKTSLFVPDRRNFYFFLYPDKAEEAPIRKIARDNKYTGSYFDVMESIELDENNGKQSLTQLAEKLKEARLKTSPLPSIKKNIEEKTEKIISKTENTEVSEENARRLIKEKKYHEAILILNELYFNNPKKSIYFADQIRFLEKALENLKK